LIALLTINLMVLIYKPIRSLLEKQYYLSTKEERIQRRYATVDKWLITKVRKRPQCRVEWD
jgi:hypothetical protein